MSPISRFEVGGVGLAPQDGRMVSDEVEAWAVSCGSKVTSPHVRGSSIDTSSGWPRVNRKRSALFTDRSAIVGQQSRIVGQESARAGQKLATLGQELARAGQEFTIVGQELATLGQKLARAGQELAIVGQKIARRSPVSGVRRDAIAVRGLWKQHVLMFGVTSKGSC